uniref:ribonuclease H n=1 Tax=Knipowitschia caucasica TaxID=637954 RepID=A0AAV2KDB0_KNICA
MASSIPPPEEMKLTGDIASNWDNFRTEFEDYSLASELADKDEKVQAATLRRVMGSECRHVYKHNLTLTAEQQEDVKAILDALENYFKPKRNVIFERYVFGNCRQDDSEPIDSFVTRLREKAASCDYGELREELIRDRLVLGISDEGVRRRLLREKDLTLSSAIDMCRGAEMTDIKLKMMTPDRLVESVNITYKRQQRPTQRSDRPQYSMQGTGNDITCKYCGGSHKRGRDACPAFGKACRRCGTQNHFAKVCMKKSRPDQRVNAADNINSDDDDTDQIYTAESIGALHGRGKKWFATLKLNGGLQRCQLDSGATCNVMSIKDKRKLAPNKPLLPSKARLVLYSGETLNSVGIFRTECVVRGRRHMLDFEIVRGNQRPLLSGSTSVALGLLHFTIPDELHKIDQRSATPLTKQQLIDLYADVFTDPVQSLPGEVHFELDRSIAPTQAAPRNVPVALRNAVKAQLDKHERDGHITPVSEPTEWISNMVIVRQPEKLRICIDPKSLNTALKRSHYHMPTLEDVLYKLPKARLFTLVDARDAFLQCKLDRDSSYMTTFWTPWGRYRWLKLPFGVSVAPEVYQRKQHELLSGLSGVEPIADDILIVGCGDSDAEAVTDHDKKLLALMDRCSEIKLRLGLKKLQFKVKESMLLTLQNYNLKWRNTPTDDMDCSPAQRLMARRLKSPLPVSDSLLEPRVVADVSEKLRAKHQKAKLWRPDGKMEERCLPPTGGPSVVPGGC